MPSAAKSLRGVFESVFSCAASQSTVGIRLVVASDMQSRRLCLSESLIRSLKCPSFRGWSSKMLHGIGEAWLGRRPDTAKVAGSNPAQPSFPGATRPGSHLWSAAADTHWIEASSFGRDGYV